jgi:uncharacterized membrane protein YccC
MKNIIYLIYWRNHNRTPKPIGITMRLRIGGAFVAYPAAFESPRSCICLMQSAGMPRNPKASPHSGRLPIRGGLSKRVLTPGAFLLQNQCGIHKDAPRMAWIGRKLGTNVIEQIGLQADAARALRATIAFSVPLLVCQYLHKPTEALYISMAALNLSLPDLRGAYRIRLSILATMTLIAAGSAFLGIWSTSLLTAVVAMGGLALLGGLWRHLSADYGPAMATSSGLLYLLGLSQASGGPVAWRLMVLVGLGGAVAAVVHAGYWMVRPQQALRNAVGETWVAAANLVAAMRPSLLPDARARSESVAVRERELRAALDRTFVILDAAKNRKQAVLIAHLEDMRREVVHLTMRVIAVNTSLEPILDRPEFAECLPVVDSVLKALSDAARSTAISLTMHRPENFAASNVRLRRCRHLITALDEQVGASRLPAGEAAPLSAALAQLDLVLPRIQTALGQTAEHASLRMGFAPSLPDLSTQSMQSLAAWLRPASHPDPVLIRHAVRMAVFTMFAVALYELLDIPRGYWIAFTIMVVLQPDFGSTRKRAGARIAGTIAGIVLAGALLWVKMPLLLLGVIATLTAGLFAYFLLRNYGIAIFFVTINLVLVTETLSGVQRDFMVMRVLSTLLGGGLALVAARIFWPVWEGQMFPALLATAVRANNTFLRSMYDSFGLPAAEETPTLMSKRRAENANRYVATSVERLLGEPAQMRENPERATALATYNQRVTRALTTLAVQLPETGRLNDSSFAKLVKQISEMLERVARAIENGCQEAAASALGSELLDLEKEAASGHLSPVHDPQSTASKAKVIWVQLSKIVAEIRAMTLAMKMNT